MNLRLTETEAAAVRALLTYRADAIRSHPDAGYFSQHLAQQYDALDAYILSRPVRKGLIGLTLTKADSNRLEHLIAHDKGAVVRPVLHKIAEARRPKADPRRPNGRRVREEATA